MKKILVAAGGILILLGVTLRAEANFFVSNSEAKRCNVPNTPLQDQAWQTPNIRSDRANTNCPVIKKSPASTQCPTIQTKQSQICPSTTAQNETTRFTPVSIQDNVSVRAAPLTPPTHYKGPIYHTPPNKDKVVVIIYEGSLKNNIERILRENCWDRVVWKLPVDYRWVGTAKVSGPNLASVMDTILSPFPLEITFYHANHVAAINLRKYHE